MFTCFRGFDKREPNWIRLFMWISGDRDTFPIMKDIIKWYYLTIYLCDHELIPEFTMYCIGKIYWSCSFWESDDISFWRKDEYLISKYIHVHLLHELPSFHAVFDDILDGLHPVAVS